MSFMQMMIYKKGATYSADCARCGCTHFVHEWYSPNFNDDRDAMENGTGCCPECGDHFDPTTFYYNGKMYAGCYSAPGYLDKTDMHYGKNLKILKRELIEMYGD